MERTCGKCLMWKQNNGICPIFREKMAETELGCPKFTGEINPCDICGQPIVGKVDLAYIGIDDDTKWYELCPQCSEHWGRCLTCKSITQCDFETNPVNIPKQIQQQIRQGNMVVQTVVRNPEREKETCAKNCHCWDCKLNVCWRQYCNNEGCMEHWEVRNA